MHILGDSFFFAYWWCHWCMRAHYVTCMYIVQVGAIHTHCVFNSPPKVSMSFQTKIKPAGVKTHGLSLTYIKKNYIVTK